MAPLLVFPLAIDPLLPFLKGLELFSPGGEHSGYRIPPSLVFFRFSLSFFPFLLPSFIPDAQNACPREAYRISPSFPLLSECHISPVSFTLSMILLHFLCCPVGWRSQILHQPHFLPPGQIFFLQSHLKWSRSSLPERFVSFARYARQNATFAPSPLFFPVSASPLFFDSPRAVSFSLNPPS